MQSHLLLNLKTELSQQLLKCFILGLQLCTFLSIKKSLIQLTEIMQSLGPTEPGLDVTWIRVQSWWQNSNTDTANSITTTKSEFFQGIYWFLFILLDSTDNFQCFEFFFRILKKFWQFIGSIYKVNWLILWYEMNVLLHVFKDIKAFNIIHSYC